MSFYVGLGIFGLEEYKRDMSNAHSKLLVAIPPFPRKKIITER
jgi:hypothetical protein